MAVAATAAEAFDRYSSFYNDGRLIQADWHAEDDGRQLACALGVIGDEVDSPADCPASIMPRWLARMVPWFFDLQKPDQAFKWGLDFYAELKRLDGKVPFEVLYDWHANVVCPLGIEADEKRGRDPAPHKALQELHRRALGGERAKQAEWYQALRDANAYANADAINRLAVGFVECLRRVETA